MFRIKPVYMGLAAGRFANVLCPLTVVKIEMLIA